MSTMPQGKLPTAAVAILAQVKLRAGTMSRRLVFFWLCVYASILALMSTCGSSSSSDKRPRRTILELRGSRIVTSRALEQLVADIREHGLPESSSRSTLARQRSSTVHQNTPFGPILQTVELHLTNGTKSKTTFQHPMAMLWINLRDSDEFFNLFKKTLDANNSTLSICLYSDEITPGNVLKKNNDRKAWLIYWSFLEFTPEVLCNEAAWFIGGALLSSHVGRVSGNMSQVYRCFLQMFFGKPCGGHNFRIGVLFNIPNRESFKRLVFAHLKMLLQDADAHARTNEWKGSSGGKCCAVCFRICKKNSILLPDPTGFLLPLDTTDMSKIVPTTNTTFRSMQANLAAVSGDEAALCQKEKDYGYKYNQYNWLQDPDLNHNFMDIFAYDWVHCYVENGVWDTEFKACIAELQPHGYGCNSCNDYLQLWHWPRAYASGKDLCKSSVYKADDKDISPSGSASEFISAAPVIGKWLQSIPAGICPLIVESALLCIRVVVLLNMICTGHVTAEELAEAMQVHFNKHKEAYGDSIWKPKFHYSLHLPLQLVKHSVLLSCFVHERKHRLYKRWATSFDSKKSMERCMMEEMTLSHMNALQHSLVHATLPDAREADNTIMTALRSTCHLPDSIDQSSVVTARTLCINCRLISSGDVTFYETAPGNPNGVCEVYFHYRVHGEHYSCIAPFTEVSRTNNYVKSVVSNSPIVVESARLSRSAIFSHSPVGGITTVLTEWTCS